MTEERFTQNIDSLREEIRVFKQSIEARLGLDTQA